MSKSSKKCLRGLTNVVYVLICIIFRSTVNARKEETANIDEQISQAVKVSKLTFTIFNDSLLLTYALILKLVVNLFLLMLFYV